MRNRWLFRQLLALSAIAGIIGNCQTVIEKLSTYYWLLPTISNNCQVWRKLLEFDKLQALQITITYYVGNIVFKIAFKIVGNELSASTVGNVDNFDSL